MDDSPDLGQLLIDDVFAAVQLPKHPRERRAMIRAIFAAVEGLLARLRQHIELGATSDLTPAELLALREKTYRMTDSGENRIVPAYQTLKQQVRSTAAIVNRLHPEYLIDFSESEWGKLMGSLIVRDRLMHPKTREDMDVTFDELMAAADGFDWFYGRVIGPAHVGLGEYVDKRYRASQMERSAQVAQSHIMFGPLRNAFNLTGQESTPLPLLDAAAQLAGQAIPAPPPDGDLAKN